MRAYVIRRILQIIPVLFLTSVAICFLLRLIPGDPALTLAGPDPSVEVVEALRGKLGLDKPIYIQYLQWMGRVLRGDLGNSYVSKLPVSYLIKLHLPATIEVSCVAKC